MRRAIRWGALLALLGAAVAVAALVATSGGRAASAKVSAKKPLVIGWAYDKAGQMAPFDNPALAAAKIRVKQLNARGGAAGHKFVIKTCDTQNNNADEGEVVRARACSASGANIIFTTCDVDFATPVVAGGDQARQARDLDLHRHRPDGPEALRQAGQARVQLRKRGPGRGLGDGAVRP